MSPRKRVSAPNLPKEIRLRDIPQGVYWDPSGNGRWFVFVLKDGRKSRRTIARSDARASDLHRIVEETAGVDHTSLSYLIDQFQESNDFHRLSARTQSDYLAQARIAKALKLQTGTLGAMRVTSMSSPGFRQLMNAMAATPTKANHLARYLKRVFSYGVEYGICKSNPLKGVKMLREVKAHKMPEPKDHTDFLATIDGWLWAACEIAYLCRLRRVEVVTLTDANATAEGVMSNRRKGSRDNVTTWTPRLRAAWEAAVKARDAKWDRMKKPVPMRADARPIFVGVHGDRMTEAGFSGMFGKAMRKFGGNRFSIHGLKHRGITDTSDKTAGGHKTEAMRQRYDHEVPKHRPSGE